MICSGNQLTGFYMKGTSAFNELMFHFLKSNFQWYHTKLCSVEKPEYFVLFNIIFKKWETHIFLLYISSSSLKKKLTCVQINNYVSFYKNLDEELWDMSCNYPKINFFWRGNYRTPFLMIQHCIAWNQFHILKFK